MPAKKLVDEFLITINNKKMQFILLSMERIKEEDEKYLSTLSKENLLKLGYNIKQYCDNISIFDNNIIELCKKYKKLKLEEDDIKNFKIYSDMNDDINSYLNILMHVPLDNNFINDDIKTFLNNEKLLEPKKSSLSKSHSFSSKSSNSPHSLKSDDIYKTNLKKYSVITTSDNKDILLDAIYDYCLYTNNILNIYKRFIAIENIINYKFKEKYNIIKENLNFDYKLFNIKNLTEIYQTFDYENKKLKLFDNDKYILYKTNFKEYIIFIYSLYTYTYGYKKFKKYINNILKTCNTKEDLLNLKEVVSNHKKTLINNILFSANKKMFDDNDIENFIFNYSLASINLIKKDILYNDKEFVDSINNILFKKIKKNNEYIPRFYLLFSKDIANKVNFNFYKQKDKAKKKFRENVGKYIYITIYKNDKNDYSLIIPKSNPLDINEKVADNEQNIESPSSSSKEYV